MKLNKRGFAHLEVILLVFVAIVVVGAGFYVFKSRTSNTNVSEAESDDSTTSLKAYRAKLSASDKTDFGTKLAKTDSNTILEQGTNCSSGRGSNGPRIHMLYITPKNNMSSENVSRLRTLASGTDTIFNASAAKTGGKQKIRWVRNDNCKVDVTKVVISDKSVYSAIETPGKNSARLIRDKLKMRGFDKSNRKYIAFVDYQPNNSSVGCGDTFLARYDDRPGAENTNNKLSYQVMVGDCWKFIPGDEANASAQTARVVAMALGAPQKSSPNAVFSEGKFTGQLKDNYGIFSNENAADATFPCPITPGSVTSLLLDCNNDDYYSANPATDSYLANHWNVYNSKFLHTPTN